MKKKIALLLALLVGFAYCPSGAVVMAAGNEEKPVEAGKNEETDKKANIPENDGLKKLQIPQKLNVIIDPWEMDQKGQVYSEEYQISNSGDTPGILTLSGLACKPREQSGVVVRSDKAGIHDGGDKSIYMEMILGNGERIVFSQENSRYQTVLEPDEVLSICFTGEVNENAFGQWKNNDIAVSVVYSWETGEEINDLDEELTENKDQDDADAGEIKEAEDETNEEEKMNQDPAEEEGAEKQEEDSKEEESEEKEETEEIEEPAESDNPDDITGEDDLEPAVNEAIASEGNFNSGIKDEIKNIGLQEPQEVDVDISSWKIDEKGQIVSPQYVLENTGDTDGIWMLSELICKPKVQDTVVVKTDKNGLHDNEEKSVYMELVVGNSEKIVLSQEKSQYKVELKPGEKQTVRFIGEMNGNLFELNEDGDIEVTAICTWNLK